MESIAAFDGVVTDFVWRNPHVYVLVDRDGEDGEAGDWELQMGPINVISRRGWRQDTLQPGDQVSVRAHASLDGRPYGIIESIDKDGGLQLVAATGAASAAATADTLEGRWIADRSATMSYPGGFDGFFNALLTLNDAGRGGPGRLRPTIRRESRSLLRRAADTGGAGFVKPVFDGDRYSGRGADGRFSQRVLR